MTQRAITRQCSSCIQYVGVEDTKTESADLGHTVVAMTMTEAKNHTAAVRSFRPQSSDVYGALQL
jgi:hypothetical protein